MKHIWHKSLNVHELFYIVDKLNDLLEKWNLPNEAKTVIKMGSILNFDPIPFAVNAVNADLTKKAKNTIMPIPQGMDQTQVIIHKMLKESTGINCMDSGGDNGRSWQKNQKIFDLLFLYLLLCLDWQIL